MPGPPLNPPWAFYPFLPVLIHGFLNTGQQPMEKIYLGAIETNRAWQRVARASITAHGSFYNLSYTEVLASRTFGFWVLAGRKDQTDPPR
jgi:hypothetical protein